MRSNWIKAVLLATALLVGGCSFADNALLPSVGGGSGSSAASGTGPSPSTGSTSPTPTDTAGAPKLGTGKFQPDAVAPGKPTGTAVGQRIEAMRSDLTKLNASIGAQDQTLQALRAQSIQNAAAYHRSVGAINVKLEAGTTPGDPIVTKQWNDAQGQFGKVNDVLSGMNKLANDVAADAVMSNYLLESTRAASGISDASDEDHAQLRVLEDEVNKTTILIDRLLAELTEDISRLNSYLAGERATLALGVDSSESFGRSATSQADAPPTAPGSGIASGRPLVVIRFDKPNVDYRQALYWAVSQVLARRPNAAFDLVAVTPTSGGAAQTALDSNVVRPDADQVLRSLIAMGLSPDRVSVSSATSASAQVNEVHLYIR